MIQGDDDVAEYFEKISRCWEELDALRNKKVCVNEDTCIGCHEAVKERENKRVIEFLMGLNESHDQIRTYILALPALPTMDIAFDMVSQHESQATVTKHSAVESSAMYASLPDLSGAASKNSGRGRGRCRSTCTYCQGIGHTRETCYKLIGYPPGYKTGRGRQSQGRGNAHNVIGFVDSKSDAPSEGARTVEGPQFTPVQMNKLLALIRKDSSPDQHTQVTHVADTCASALFVSSIDTWILDSGATDHFVCNLSLLSEVH